MGFRNETDWFVHSSRNVESVPVEKILTESVDVYDSVLDELCEEGSKERDG